MQINLNQKEIEKGIITYLVTQGINTDNKKIEISLTAGRKGNGFTSSVNLHPVLEEIGMNEPEEIDLEEDIEDTQEQKLFA